MNFGEFLNESKETYEEIIKAVNELAIRRKLPTVVKYLDDSNDAVVFDTTDPNMVIRAGTSRQWENDREFIIAEDEMQETGGVTRIYFITNLDIGDTTYIISWKEKVDTNVEGFLYRVIKKQSEEAFNEIVSVLVGLYHADIKGIRLLLKYPATKPLAEAILAGLPTSDLDVSSNLGVNKKGIIVAYDC